MSHVKRKRPREPTRAVKKKRDNDIRWVAIFILILIIISFLLGFIAWS